MSTSSTRGIAYTKHLDLTQTRGVYESPIQNWNFLYEHTSTKNPNWNIGDRVCLPDGRVFRYGRCGANGIVNQKFGMKNLTILVAVKETSGENHAVTVPTVAIGEDKVTVTFTAGEIGNSRCTVSSSRTGVLAKDELRGGYISFYTGDYRQNRGIVGNTVVTDSDGEMTIYLDAALDYDLTKDTSTCEILANPYGNIADQSHKFASVMGMANVLAGANEYFWIQSWGPFRVSGITSDLGDTEWERQFVFNVAGAVVPISTQLSSADVDFQLAGFLIESTEGQVAGLGAPFINLQINP